MPFPQAPRQTTGIVYTNRRTGKTYTRTPGTPYTDQEARDVLPQDEDAQGLYSVLRERGLSVDEALLRTFRAVIAAMSDDA